MWPNPQETSSFFFDEPPVENIIQVRSISTMNKSFSDGIDSYRALTKLSKFEVVTLSHSEIINEDFIL